MGLLCAISVSFLLFFYSLSMSPLAMEYAKNPHFLSMVEYSLKVLMLVLGLSPKIQSLEKSILQFKHKFQKKQIVR